MIVVCVCVIRTFIIIVQSRRRRLIISVGLDVCRLVGQQQVRLEVAVEGEQRVVLRDENVATDIHNAPARRVAYYVAISRYICWADAAKHAHDGAHAALVGRVGALLSQVDAPLGLGMAVWCVLFLAWDAADVDAWPDGVRLAELLERLDHGA